MSILRRLGLVASEVAPKEATVLEALEVRLSALGAKRAEFVAAFAGLLARVAFADAEISEAEVGSMERLITGHGGLTVEEAQAVVLVARNRTIALAGADAHLLTRRFNELAGEEDRRHLVDCLYAVAAADDVVAHVEDREVRRVADALLLPAREVLEIRSRYRERLEELRLLRKVRGEGT